jgi:hypothetical protein
MKRLRITGILEYDDEEMHSGDRDPEAREWFDDILRDPRGLVLHSHELGDAVGDLMVESVEEPAEEARS